MATRALGAVVWLWGLAVALQWVVDQRVAELQALVDLAEAQVRPVVEAVAARVVVCRADP